MQVHFLNLCINVLFYQMLYCVEMSPTHQRPMVKTFCSITSKKVTDDSLGHNGPLQQAIVYNGHVHVVEGTFLTICCGPKPPPYKNKECIVE